MATWLRVRGWAVERAGQLVERKRLVASVVLSALLLLGCPPTTQQITVTNNGSSLSVNGTGFANIPNCAQLALVGLPPPQAAVSMGFATCSGGGFSNFNWRFAAITAPGSTQQCQFTGQQDAVVTATDQTNSQIATAKTSIIWGPNCALICGKAFEPACPAGCLEGEPLINGICCGPRIGLIGGTIPCGEHCCTNGTQSCSIAGGVPHCETI
jgi:hypothetical protein